MSTHLSTLDPEPDLLEAFASFDEHNTGFVKSSVLKEWLSGTGDRMTNEEVRFFASATSQETGIADVPEPNRAYRSIDYFIHLLSIGMGTLIIDCSARL